MRHFAHNIGDYAAATAHLSFVEDAAYHRLLRRYYQDERALPADIAECQRLVGARSKEERKAVESVLREFFLLKEDGFHQSRADREIEIYRAKADSARENGTKGGRPANRTKTNPVSPPVQSGKLTTPHSPLDNSEANASGASAPQVDPVKALFDEGVKLLTENGSRESSARSIIAKWRKENGDEAAHAAIKAARAEGVTEPISWITQRFSAKPRESWRERQIREGEAAIDRALA